MGRRTLAQELADLATTAPTQELDLERDELGGGAVLVETDDELDELPSRSGKLAGLRLRGDIELPEQAYSGRKTTRSAAFQSSESEGDEEELEEEDAEAAGGDDQQSAGKDEPEEAGITQADDRHAKGQAGYVQEMENLERQYDAVQAVDEAMLAKVRQRGEADRKKGRAVKHQRTIWDKVLEMRILLQRCASAANRMPQPPLQPAASQATEELREGYQSLTASACATVDALLELQDALVAQNPAIWSAAASTPEIDAGGAEAQADQQPSNSSSAAWQKIEAAYARFVPYRDASLDRWHRKTLLSSGSAAMQGNLRALNQSVSSQVASLMQDPHKAVQRSQLLRATAPPVLGKRSAPSADQPEHSVAVCDPSDVARDPETFDDSEFYQQLLKEFLEGVNAAGSAGTANLFKGAKKRKLVDRRASKGRKLRYHVQEKLVNFMAPVQAETPAVTMQLFSNLFGRATA